ncbi:MAG TPA: hypothetical protein PLD14_00135 [Candidatus Pacearchaeota archaeon]|nr:hypothetical protein [Candidatus Pacearchaeota archaeon]HPR79622.1 hypothetical protein [Candidatus Pacearchaeota archaeon]
MEQTTIFFANPFPKAHPQSISSEDEPLKEWIRRRFLFIHLFRIYSLFTKKMNKE